MEHRVSFVGRAQPERRDLEDVYSVEAPAVGPGNLDQLIATFGESDIETTLSEPDALQQELKRQGRLAAAGCPIDEIKMVRGDPAAEDLVETGDSRARAGHHHVAAAIRRNASTA